MRELLNNAIGCKIAMQDEYNKTEELTLQEFEIYIKKIRQINKVIEATETILLIEENKIKEN